MHVGSMSSVQARVSAQCQQAVPGGFVGPVHQPHFAHATPTSHLMHRFLPLDLSHSSTMYGLGLYAAAAAANGAHISSSSPLNPLLQSHFVGLSTKGMLPNGNGAAFLGATRTEERRSMDANGNSAQSQQRPSVVVGMTSSGGGDGLLPRNNMVKVANADYLGVGMNGGPHHVSSSCVDSDGSSSSNSSSSSSSSTSRHTPPNPNKDPEQASVITKPNPHFGHNGSSISKLSTDIRRSEKKRKGVVRDDAYWERRRKNNDAAKRSRDSRRQKEDEVAVKAAILEQENLRLRFEIDRLKDVKDRLKTEVERHRLAAFTAASHPSLAIKEMDVEVEKLPAPSPLKFVHKV